MTLTRRPSFSLAGAMLASVLILALASPASARATDGGARPDSVMNNTFVGNYLSARQAQRDGDLAAAAVFYGAALKQKPETPGLLRQAFVVHLIEGRMDAAVKLAHRYLALNPEQTIARLTIAVDHMKRKRFSDAENALAKLPDQGLSTFTKPLLKTWTRFAQKRGEGALTALEPLADHKGMENLAEIHQALVLQLIGKADEAAKLLTAVVERQSPPTSRVTHLLGALYERKGDGARARALYRLYLDAHPSSRLMDQALARLERGEKPPMEVATANDGAAEALHDMGASLRRQNANETAVALIRLALYLKPDFPVAQFTLANILEQDDRLEASVETYNKVAARSAYGWSARLQAAALLGDMKKREAAVKLLTALIKERPDIPDAHLQLGNVYRRSEAFDKAVKAYSAAIDLVGSPEPHHWSLYYARGIVFERVKRWSDSEKDLLKALDLRPEQPYVLNYLGYSWIDRGENLERGTEMIKKAVSLAPNDGYIADSLGWAFYRLGKFKDAVKELERAVELRPQDAVINDHLGDAYWKVGRKLEARFQWKRSLSLDPDADLVPKIKEKLSKGLDG